MSDGFQPDLAASRIPPMVVRRISREDLNSTEDIYVHLDCWHAAYVLRKELRGYMFMLFYVLCFFICRVCTLSGVFDSIDIPLVLELGLEVLLMVSLTFYGMIVIHYGFTRPENRIINTARQRLSTFAEQQHARRLFYLIQEHDPRALYRRFAQEMREEGHENATTKE